MEMLLKYLRIEYEHIQKKLPQFSHCTGVQDILLQYVEGKTKVGNRRICDLTDAVNDLNLGVRVIRKYVNDDNKKNGIFITREQIEQYIDKWDLICVNLYTGPKYDIGHSNILHAYDPDMQYFNVIDPVDKNKKTLSFSEFENKWIDISVPYSELFYIDCKV
jgi:cytochrome oxidase Cu insertion factor (SCO1/SenC/PrrC family)